MNTFRADIEAIRRRALEKMDDGAVTAFYKAEIAKFAKVIEDAKIPKQ